MHQQSDFPAAAGRGDQHPGKKFNFGHTRPHNVRCIRSHDVQRRACVRAQLLVPPSGTDDVSKRARVDLEKADGDETTIVSSLLNTFVLRHSPPQLQRAKEMVSRCPYTGSEGEEDIDKNLLVTWEALEQNVQASTAELKIGLTTMGALEIDGHWRIVDESYLSEVTQLVLGLLVENDWPYTAVPHGACVEQLPDYCPHVVRHCLAFYGQPVEGADGLWSLDSTKVSAWVAQRLLSPGGTGGEPKEWPKSKFLDAWNDDTPEGITPELGMLRVRQTMPRPNARATDRR